jgi:hypothetical protein
MEEFDIKTLFGDTMNQEEVDVPKNGDEDLVEVVNENDAETVMDEMMEDSKESDGDDDETKEDDDKPKNMLKIDPDVDIWSQMFVEASELYSVLRKSNELPKGVPEPTIDMDINTLKKAHAVLRCKHGKLTKTSGVAEEALMAFCNLSAHYFDGSGDQDTFNPDLSALPDDIGLKIERDPSLKASLKNISGNFKNDYLKIGTSIVMSIASIGMSSKRRRRDVGSKITRAVNLLDH